jgi:hypothetical protein
MQAVLECDALRHPGRRTAVEIRRFQAGDEPALREVFYAAIHKTAAAHYSEKQIRVWAQESYDPAAVSKDG